MYLTNQGIYIKTSITKPFQDKFTLKVFSGHGDFTTSTTYKYYLLKPDGIVIPRCNTSNTSILNTIKHPNLPFNCVAKFSPNQNLIINHVVSLFNSFITHDKKPLRTGITLVAPTGLGKTYLALGLLTKFCKKTLYVVYDKKSLFAVLETLKRELPQAKIGTYYSGSKSDGDIVVGIINSVLKIPSSDFGCVIYDEIPEYVTPERWPVFFKFNTCFNIGLTATPYKNGLEKIYQDCVGPLLDVTNLPGYENSDTNFEGQVRKFNYKIKNKAIIDGHIDFMGTLKLLSKDVILTSLIINEINYLLGLGKNLYVFSEIKSYLYHISSHFSQGLILIGGAKPQDFEKAKTANLIFTTYKFGEKALSLSHMNAIFYITPRRQAMQSSGRITRMDGNLDEFRLISDLVHDCFKRQFDERKKAYKARGFKIGPVDF